MAVGERQTQAQQRRKTPSFSSSLLDAIYHSIDETRDQQVEDFVHCRRKNAARMEEEIESLRRTIMVEKWMENYSSITTSRHLSSNSGSSTDSSMFSSSETKSSASRSTPKSSDFPIQKPKHAPTPPTERPENNFQMETTSKLQGRFTRTKSRAMKIYGDLKKVKEPISPGGKIANFLNSIFSPKILKKNPVLEEWSSLRKSRSMKDTTTWSLASKSCLSKNSSSARGNKTKRSVKFCPVSVIVDEDSRPCGYKSIYGGDYSISTSMPNVSSQFIKKNIHSLRLYEVKNMRKHEFGYFCDYESDVDDKSCGSSDLFELENIGKIGIGAYEEELPVYGTTSLKMNQAIASGFIM